MCLEKFDKKLLIIKNLLFGKKVLVAISGGVDSTLILLLALKYAKKIIPVYINAPIFSTQELNFTREICTNLEIQLEIIELNLLENSEFKSNNPNRCYFCKKIIMGAMVNIKKEMNFDEVLEGTNITEITIEKERPGYKALNELGVISPLVEANFTKSEVREMIGYIKENFNLFFSKKYITKELRNILSLIEKKPSNPCLCTRVEFNIPIVPEILRMIDEAEKFLLNTYNTTICRVRYHRNHLARIEIDKDHLEKILNSNAFELILEKFKKIGFKYITIDLEGYRGGSFN